MANKSNENENKRIGRLLKRIREQYKVSQADLVASTGLSKNHISAIERGLSKPSVDCLLGYCEKLNVTPNDILGYTNSEILPELEIELAKANKEQQRRILEIIKVLLDTEL